MGDTGSSQGLGPLAGVAIALAPVTSFQVDVRRAGRAAHGRGGAQATSCSRGAGGWCLGERMSLAPVRGLGGARSWKVSPSLRSSSLTVVSGLSDTLIQDLSVISHHAASLLTGVFCSGHPVLHVSRENTRERLQLQVGHLVAGLPAVRGGSCLRVRGPPGVSLAVLHSPSSQEALTLSRVKMRDSCRL